MKKRYEKATIEIMELKFYEIITTSGGLTDGNDGWTQDSEDKFNGGDIK